MTVAALVYTLKAPPPPGALHGCLPPNDKHSFCDATLPAEKRAALVAPQLTVAELVGMLQGDQPAVQRLGIPAYHYGYEALLGLGRVVALYCRSSTLYQN